jgi:tight adherence protein B
MNSYRSHNFSSKHRRILLTSSILVAALLVAYLFSHSPLISAAFSVFIAIIIFIAQERGGSKRSSSIQGACPELIDILISGVQSGLSLNESLAGLATRGPEIFRADFEKFVEDIYRSGDFNRALTEVKESLAHPSVDQIIEALMIARELGGAELLTILRLLGRFIRDDLALRREIEVKQNWIRNSAHLSAAAPWILLLLLSTQPSTAEAFSNSTGVLILCLGLGLTAIAYLWMNVLSRIPTPSRIFVGRTELVNK